METTIKLTKLSSCAGCGAKVGAGTLAKLLGDMPTHHDPNLLVGFDRSDDASVYRVSDALALVQTVDFFPPIVDDPFTFGQIAATNALSDVYAMGGEPKLALNLLCIPETMPQSAVQAILAGGYSKVFEAGAIITGGHSIFDDVPKYGLSVTGFVHPDKFFKNHGAREGDVLFLTTQLGVGILTTAEKAEMLETGEIDRAIALMTTLNKGARDCAVRYRVHACTDVTGFSLMGHMLEMMQGSDVTARVETRAIEFLPRVLEFAKMGLLPAGVYRNRNFAEPFVDEGNLPLEVRDALFDPQTSGGLLIAVDHKDADALERDLCVSVPSTQRIGTVIAKSNKSIYLV
jgi:selenide,water dikinase